MLHQAFYDPEKTYEENFNQGPFGAFADGKLFKQHGVPKYDVFGNKVYLPFGIPPGPLVNGKFVKAALDKGFDVVTYKTVRTKKYPCNEFPNVLAVHPQGDLTLKMADKGLVGDQNYTEPLAITNSFGVPSFDPDFWQKDLSEAAKYAGQGQLVIGGFQGTTGSGEAEYIQDFVKAAKLVKETGVKVLEVNLSCPNEGTAHLLCFDTPRVQTIVDAIKNEIGNTPLIIKLAFFAEQEQLEDLVERINKSIDGIATINTIPAKIYKNKDYSEQALPGKNRLVSGVCGEPIKWAGLDMVKRLDTLRKEKGYKYTIFGIGGVKETKDYQEYRNAGADVVQSATGAMWNPFLAQEIKASVT